jgi:hypothetical protein
MAFEREPGAQMSAEGEWADQVIALTSDYDVITLYPSGNIFAVSPQSHFHFRCVTPLLS